MAERSVIDLAPRQVRAFLAERFDPAARDVALLGAGAWSRCYGFSCAGRALVARFGRYGDDFQKDRLAARYRSPDLPIPDVLALGRAFDGFYAVSTRAYGTPLEEVAAAHWRLLLPALAGALEALRTADLTAARGWGGWDGAGAAAFPSWSSYLLAVGDDTPERRTHGWRARLAAFPEAAATFRWGYERLGQLASDDVPRGLIHGDLLNRNVLVGADTIGGVFDWGCAAYGDHLYDLAWCMFWAPWHPGVAADLLRAALGRRWRAAGYAPQQFDARLGACLLHIGLDHLAYHAYRGDGDALAATAARMRALAA